MASLKFIEQKKAKEVSEINRKLDLIMAKLGIADVAPVTEPAVAPATEASEADTEPSTKGKGKK